MSSYRIAIIPGDGVGNEVALEFMARPLSMPGKPWSIPIASIESIRMMLEHPGEERAALDIQKAVMKTIAMGKVKTPDIGGTHKTHEVGDAVKKALLNK